MNQNRPKINQKSVKIDQKSIKIGSWGPRGPKSGPRALQDRKTCPGCYPSPPKLGGFWRPCWPQEPPTGHLKTIQNCDWFWYRFLIDFGSILEGFWMGFGTHVALQDASKNVLQFWMDFWSILCRFGDVFWMLFGLENHNKSTTTLTKESYNNTTTTKLKKPKSIVFYNTEWPSAILHQKQHEVENSPNTHQNITKRCQKKHPNSKDIFPSILGRFSYPNASQNATKINQKII